MDWLGLILMIIGLAIFFIGLTIFLQDQKKCIFGSKPKYQTYAIRNEEIYEIN